MLAAELEAKGVKVEYTPPMEERGAGEQVAGWVVMYVIERVGVDPIVRAVVHDFRRRYPNLRISVDGESSVD